MSHLLASITAALLTGGAHYVAHRVSGDESTFDDAGVKWGGLAASLVAGVTAYAAVGGFP